MSFKASDNPKVFYVPALVNKIYVVTFVSTFYLRLSSTTSLKAQQEELATLLISGITYRKL